MLVMRKLGEVADAVIQQPTKVQAAIALTYTSIGVIHDLHVNWRDCPMILPGL